LRSRKKASGGPEARRFGFGGNIETDRLTKE
jgi:hypothetical protein